MKKIIFTLLCIVSVVVVHAQLAINRTLSSYNGNQYLELVNSGTSTAQTSLGCYSLVTYFKTSTERGVYVINLPERNLSSDGVLVIGSAVQPYQNSSNTQLILDWKTLFTEGHLRRYVINENNSFASVSLPSNYTELFRQSNLANEPSDHMVLLFQGTTLIDASATLDAHNNLPDFVSRLSDLSFTNTCGNLATVRFSALRSMYPNIFNRINSRREFGQFRAFDVQRNSGTVQIAWQTSREQQNRGFEIERRNLNGEWSTVAYVASLAPEGNSDRTLQYLYGDNTAMKGQTQYRLRQIDVNGRTTYSPVKTLNAVGEQDNVVVFPNPSPDGRTNISFRNVNTPRDVAVLDINGQLIQQWISVNNTNQQISNLRAGQYFIRVIDRMTGSVTTEKLIVQH